MQTAFMSVPALICIRRRIEGTLGLKQIADCRSDPPLAEGSLLWLLIATTQIRCMWAWRPASTRASMEEQLGSRLAPSRTFRRSPSTHRILKRLMRVQEISLPAGSLKRSTEAERGWKWTLDFWIAMLRRWPSIRRYRIRSMPALVREVSTRASMLDRPGPKYIRPSTFVF